MHGEHVGMNQTILGPLIIWLFYAIRYHGSSAVVQEAKRAKRCYLQGDCEELCK